MAELLSLRVKNAKFITVPKRRKIAGVKQFVFDSVGEVHIWTNQGVKIFNIPAGFICDSTSFLWFVDSAGDIHDFGYCVQGAKKGFTRKFWDKVYYHLMLDLDFPKWKAKYRYLGVRAFGWIAYKKRRKEKYHTLKMQSVREIINKWGV